MTKELSLHMLDQVSGGRSESLQVYIAHLHLEAVEGKITRFQYTQDLKAFEVAQKTGWRHI